jgi:hypothetical protein
MTASAGPCYNSAGGGREVLIYLNAPLRMRVHLIFDNAVRTTSPLYTARRPSMESSDMEYLSAIGPVLILMLFGGGIVIVAYLAFDDMRTRGTSFSAASFNLSLTSVIERLKALPITTAIMAGAVVLAGLFIYLVADSGYYARPPAAPEATASEPAPAAETTPAAAPAAKAPAAKAAAPAAAPAPPAAKQTAAPAPAATTAIAAVRTVTSTSCASNGCPVSCAADEILTSAYCVGGGDARLADQLQVKDGVVTAKCSPSDSSIKVACARK